MKDLIDREAAIDALGEAPKFKIGLLKKYAEGRNDQWFDDVAALVNLPSAQPKRGRWERHYCEDGNPDGWQCDCCGEWFYFGDMKPNFCPNCGSDMRGTEND